MAWRVEVLDEAKAALTAMPVDIRASFARIAHLIEEHGLSGCASPTSGISKAGCGRCA